MDLKLNELQRGVPNYNWEKGTLKYIRCNEPPKEVSI